MKAFQDAVLAYWQEHRGPRPSGSQEREVDLSDLRRRLRQQESGHVSGMIKLF